MTPHWLQLKEHAFVADTAMPPSWPAISSHESVADVWFAVKTRKESSLSSAQVRLVPPDDGYVWSDSQLALSAHGVPTQSSAWHAARISHAAMPWPESMARGRRARGPMSTQLLRESKIPSTPGREVALRNSMVLCADV